MWNKYADSYYAFYTNEEEKQNSERTTGKLHCAMFDLQIQHPKYKDLFDEKNILNMIK